MSDAISTRAAVPVSIRSANARYSSDKDAQRAGFLVDTVFCWLRPGEIQRITANYLPLLDANTTFWYPRKFRVTATPMPISVLIL